MTRSIRRMQFLRGDLSGRRSPIRPPWSPVEALFVERCDRCGDCVAACPRSLLIKGRGGFPEVDFSRAGCDFCGDCLRVCAGKALSGDVDDTAAAWAVRAEIGGTCLSLRGVVCRACGEVCDESAIRFRLEIGGVARPLLDTGRCSGCGACAAACPVQAVQMAAQTAAPHAVPKMAINR